jgi:lysophospholipase L1-like esterase
MNTPYVKLLKICSFVYAPAITVGLVGLALHDQLPQRLYNRLHPAPVVVTEDPTLKLQRNQYEARTTQFNYLTAKDKVVFVGNSLIEGGNWDELLHSESIVNRGIGGDYSNGIAKRLGGYIAQKPRCIVYLDGINDFARGYPLPVVVANFKRAAEETRAKHIPLIALSTLYVSNQYGPAEKVRALNRIVADYNAQLSTYCQANQIPYVDANQVLASDSTLVASYSIDGVHLKGPGYQRWAKLLEKPLRPYL